MKKLIVLGVLLVLLSTGCSLTGGGSKTISLEDAKILSADFINNNLMQPGTQVSVKEVTEADGMYKVIINMPSGQEIISYLTKDGKKFFPQVMDIEEIEKKTAENNTGAAANDTAQAENVPKQEKTKVELFVMSHCPYGTQIEKGIIPAIKALGDSVDFELKFCNYAMHGKKELDEQLNQYCIQKNEPAKLIPYLECFLEADKGEECLTTVKIDTGKLRSCVASTDKEYKVTELFDDKSTWVSGQFPQFLVNDDDNKKYSISGSPGLVVNGQKVSSGRDSASLLGIICSGYENEPEACATQVSAVAPGPGFGWDTTGTGASNADCGN